MATRTISTKVAIEGEAEYKNGISKINDELKTLASSLKTSESNFRSSQNSMDALKEKANILDQTLEKQKQKYNELNDALDNSKFAQSSYLQQMEDCKSKISATESQLEQMKSATGDTTEEQKKLATQLETEKNTLQDLEARYQATEKSINEWQRQINSTQRALNGLNDDIAKNSSYMDEAETSTDGCAKSIDKFGREVKETGKEVQEAGEKTKKSTTWFGDFGRKVTTLFSAAGLLQILNNVGQKILDFGRAAIDTADKVGTMSTITGMSTDKLQELTYAGNYLDVELPTITDSWKRLINNMDSAMKGSGDAYDGFQRLGVAITDANGQMRDSNTVFNEAIDALGRLTNETERDAIAQNLFGKSATDLNPLIKAGGDELARLSDEAERTGAVMSGTALDALDKLGEDMDAAKIRLQTFVGEGLAAIISGAPTAAEKFEDLSDSMASDSEVQTLIDKYRDLSAQLENGAISAADANAASAELADVKQQLIAASGGVITTFDLENGKFAQQVDVLQACIDANGKFNRYNAAHRH